MGYGLEIEEKNNFSTDSRGKLSADELNKLVATLDKPLVLTQSENISNSGLGKSINKMNKTFFYLVTNDDPNNILCMRSILDDAVDTIDNGMSFILIPNLDIELNGGQNLSVNGNTPLPLTVKVNDIDNNYTLKANAVYRILCEGDKYVVINGLNAPTNGTPDIPFKAAEPVDDSDALTLGKLKDVIREYEDTWEGLTACPTPKTYTGAIYYNNGISNLMVTYGGTASEYNERETWEYNIDLDTWRQLTDGPLPRYDHTCLYYKDANNVNKMLVFGGLTTDGANILKDLWEYNLDTNIWTQLQDGSFGVYANAAITYEDLNGDLIMVLNGGYTDNGPSNITIEYNINTEIWSILSSGPSSRFYNTALYYNDGTNNTMLVYGGTQNVTDHMKDFWKFNLDTNTWTQLDDGPIENSNFMLHLYEEYGRPYILMIGENYVTQGPTKGVWRYDIIDESWSRLPDALYRINDCSGGVHYRLGDKNYIIWTGIWGNEGIQTDTWKYKIPTT